MLQFVCKKALALTVLSVLIPISSAWALTGESFKAYEDLKAQSGQRNKVTEENINRILKNAFEKQPESVGEVHSLDVHILGLAEVEAAFAYQNSKEACQGEQILRSIGKPYLRVSCVNRVSLNERKVWIVLDQSENPAIKEILLKQDKRKL